MRKTKSMIDHKPMFSKDHFKYIFVLTVLAWMTYTLPSVRAAFETAYASDGSDNLAAVTSSSVGDFFLGLIGRAPQQQEPGRDLRTMRLASGTPTGVDREGMVQYGSSTEPRWGRPSMGSTTPGMPLPPREQGDDRSMGPKPIPPQEIVALLVKLGYIPSDKADAAHKAVESALREHASSTPMQPPMHPMQGGPAPKYQETVQ